MAYRNIYVTQRSHISVSNSNLLISQQDKRVSIPAEDILSVVVEDRSSTVTAYAMSYLAQKDVAIYFCDRMHLPNSVHLPFSSHVRKLRKSDHQWSLSIPNQKQLWREIVVQKILNQAECLRLSGRHEVADILIPIAKEVKSGDTTNREGYAAQLYFKALFGNKFTRNKELSVNSYLNYGYTIVRGVIARSITAYGFNPEKGIFHKNEFNNFNLADDFIEPYRPVVDLFVKEILVNTKEELVNTIWKARLYDVINYVVRIRDKKYSIATSIEQVVQSFSRCLEEKKTIHLLLPSLIPLERTEYE